MAKTFKEDDGSHGRRVSSRMSPRSLLAEVAVAVSVAVVVRSIMADRLTQVQDAVNQLADHFCNSIGIIQQSASLGSLGVQRSTQPVHQPEVTQEGHANLFATLITRTAKDIDYLIDSLPSEQCSADLQISSLQLLEQENAEAGNKLERAIKDGEQLLDEIRGALKEIAESLLQSQNTTIKQ